MKKPAVILILALVGVQVLTLVRIGSLQTELQNVRNQLSIVQSSLTGQIGSLSARLATQAKEQSSIVDSFEYKLGTFDQERLAVSVTFAVTPKTSSASTRALLDVASERVDMVKQGAAFIATVPVGIFTPFAAKVTFVDGGQERTQKLEVRENLRQEVLPTVFASLERTSGAGSGFIKPGGATSGVFTETGRLRFDVKPVPGNTIEKVRLVIDIDGKVLSEKPVIQGTQITEVNEKLPLAAGQTVTMTVEATDSFGLRHQVVVNRFGLDANASPVGQVSSSHTGEATILGKGGKVLYKPLG